MEFVGIAILTFIIPPVLCLLLYRWLKKKGWVKTAWLPLVLLLAYAYVWYDAFYPSDKFYKDEFVEIIDIPLPVSAKIIGKSASYPDQHGDYAACAAFEFSANDFDLVVKKIQSNSSFSLIDNNNSIVYSDTFSTGTKKFSKSKYLLRFSGKNSKYSKRWGAYVFIGFLTDHKTVIVYRVSS